MGYKLTADSTCDLSQELLLRYDVALMGLKVMLGDDEYIDRVNIEASDIFDYYDNTKQLPKTAARNANEYEQFFSQYTASGQTVIHFSLSSELSLSYNSAVTASNNLRQQGHDVYVIDTRSLSNGSALLIIKAHTLLNSGMSIPMVVQEIYDTIPRVQTSFCVDTLDYLAKGGRCSTLAKLGANLLKIHPYINMQGGRLVMYRKIIGNMNRVLRQYINMLEAQYQPEKDICFVVHAHCDATLVAEIMQYIQDKFGFDEVIEQLAGCTITAHCGQGTLGVMFVNKQQ